jgi:chromosome segregation ATPase
MKKKTTLESISSQISALGKEVAGIKATMATKEDIADLREDIAELRGRTGALESGQEEILEKLNPLSRAYDKDAVTIVDHGRRIARLERQVGV